MQFRNNLLKENPFSDILGQNKAKKMLSSALIMKRNIVIFGPPGIGKTTIAKNVASLLPKITVNDCSYNCLPDKPVCPLCRKKNSSKKKISKGIDRFIRIQGSPDLTSEDLLGDIDPLKAMKHGTLSMEAFTPGKIFKANNGVLFFDELNRCPEKLQNALLQVLEEGKATIGSYDVDIPARFLFIATMNPSDTNTEKLSDVLLDRFDVVYMDYPETIEIEKNILKQKAENIVHFPEKLLDILTGFIRHLRESGKLEKVPSVRASIGLYERAQGNALLRKADTVNLSDLTDAVKSVLAHRIRLKPNLRYSIEPDEFIDTEYEKFTEGKGGDG